MIQLKLKEPFDLVFVNLNLVSPGTGATRTIDAKIDTGATVTVVPSYMVDGLGLEVMETRILTTADGSPMQVYVCPCIISFTDEDMFEMPIYVSTSKVAMAFVGMDILKHCNYVQWHDWKEGKHTIHFDLELLDTI